MDATSFPNLREKRFSLKTTPQWRQKWARPILKCAVLSFGSNDIFSDSL